ncbi:hypothetical protein [Actinokineospora enzanensis]|uniref:hypothetical protein n=1 Tax=Actinokineospora enzanensis TaxID=155975 RepID=UPI0003809F13|nr:hypothetical protein [Actinokineospora enzanensis]
MIDRNGPLPRAVYLRRRLAAVAATAFGVVVLVWIIGGLVGHDEGSAARNSAGPASAHPSDPPSTTPSSAPSSTAPPTSSAPAPPPPPPPPPPPDPNLPCPDQAMAISAEPRPGAFQAGSRPTLLLVVVNAGPVPCTRDIGRAQRELTIDGGTGRLWSSNDCVRVDGAEPTILAPGQRVEFPVRWAGRTSAPGCPVKRTTVPPGQYMLTPRVGGLVGPPVPLTIQP